MVLLDILKPTRTATEEAPTWLVTPKNALNVELPKRAIVHSAPVLPPIDKPNGFAADRSGKYNIAAIVGAEPVH